MPARVLEHAVIGCYGRGGGAGAGVALALNASWCSLNVGSFASLGQNHGNRGVPPIICTRMMGVNTADWY